MRDVAGTAAQPGTVLDLLLELLEGFRREGIRYCYWKSGRRLERALSGGSDLDLLVARADRDRTLALLSQSGFKPFAAVPFDDPAVMSFLGHDEPSGRIVHVHLHFRVVLGPSLLKAWRPPWEAELLAHAVPHPSMPVRVLDPASEALLLLARSAVEFDACDIVSLRNRRRSSEKFAADRAALAPRLDRAQVRARAAALFGAEAAEPAAEAACDARAPSIAVRRRVRAALAPFCESGAISRRIRLVVRSALFAARMLNKRALHAPRPWSRRAPGGGAVVAVLGVDGSGKSTLVRALRSWLGAEADVLPLYFGTGDGRPSLLLLPLKLMVPLADKVFRRKPAGASHGAVSRDAPGRLYSILMTVWASMLALEKRQKLRAARRAADRGMVVVADRFPQDQIPGFNDGPLLGRLSGVPSWLRRFEARAYDLANRLPPDLVIKLRASPELIAQREPTMHPGVVRQRTEQVMQLDFPASRVVVLDASQPLEAVIAAAKRAVWALL